MHNFQEDVNAMYWPVNLTPNAAEEYEYSNLEIEYALQNAENSMIRVVLEQTPHPIMAQPAKWNKKNKGTGGSFAQDHFSYSILPGDRSLAASAAVQCAGKLKQHLHAQRKPLDDCLPVLKVLCDLVIL